MPVIIVACMETMSFVWGYGLDRLIFDVDFMEQAALTRYWVRCWKLLSPMALLAAVIACCIALQRYVGDLQGLGLRAGLGATSLLVIALAGVPVLLITWLFENNLVSNAIRGCVHVAGAVYVCAIVYRHIKPALTNTFVFIRLFRNRDTTRT